MLGENINTPFHRLDNYTSSGVGWLASMGLDWHSSNKLSGLYGDVLDLNTRSRSAAGSYASSHLSKDRVKLAKQLKQEASSISKGSRNFFRRAFGDVPWWGKAGKLGALVDTPAKAAHHRAAGLLMRQELVKTTQAGGGMLGYLQYESSASKALYKQGMTAVRMQNLAHMGNAALGLSIGFDLARGAVNGAVQHGIRTTQTNRFSAAVPEGFMDTGMAHTTRQRALQALQATGSMYNRALGNEARLLHSGDL